MKSRLFAGLDDTVVRPLLSAAQLRRIAPKKNVVTKGGRPENLFLLQAGRAKYYILTECGDELLLLWVVPGDVIGLVSLLANPPSYMADATTVTECEFLVWDHGTIRRFVKAYPQLIENSFRLALHYLGAYMKRHANIMTENAEARLAQTLLSLATEAGEVRQSGVAIDITNEELGSLSDVSPFATSRLLSKWQRERKVSKQRGQVTLLAPEFLMAA